MGRLSFLGRRTTTQTVHRSHRCVLANAQRSMGGLPTAAAGLPRLFVHLESKATDWKSMPAVYIRQAAAKPVSAGIDSSGPRAAFGLNQMAARRCGCVRCVFGGDESYCGHDGAWPSRWPVNMRARCAQVAPRGTEAARVFWFPQPGLLPRANGGNGRTGLGAAAAFIPQRGIGRTDGWAQFLQKLLATLAQIVARFD